LEKQVDTLMKYLLDSLQNYEVSHMDALRPIEQEDSGGFCGEKMLTSPVTSAELREFVSSTDRKFDVLMDTLNNIRDASREPASGKAHTNRSRPAITSPYPPPSQRPRVAALANQPAPKPSNPPQTTPPTLPSSAQTLPLAPPSSVDPLNQPQPPADLLIPGLPHGKDAWREAVKQWEKGDPSAGLHLALKDWPKPWYSRARSQNFGAKRRIREIIGLEFQWCV
jgi:hypothetical protein